MFLSHLLIDTAMHADRPRPGRNWIRNPYRVHQRLWMAFPNAARVEKDQHFLDPFVPAEFQAAPSSGVVRNEQAGFLFRIDAVPASSPSRHVITVQSATKPNWDYAFHNAPEFLHVPEYVGVNPKVVEIAADFLAGQTLRFRLRANPTKRICSPSFRPDVHNRRAHWYEKTTQLQNGEQRHPSRRIGLVSPDEQAGWLTGKAKESGFDVSELHKAFSEGTITAWKANHDADGPDHYRMSLVSAFFEGRLIVRDADAFRRTLLAGIGTAKGLGFGLLSVTER